VDAHVQDGTLNTHRLHGYLSKICVPVASASGCQHLRSASTGLLLHDRLAELCCCRTVTVEQSSCCSMETRDDGADFQQTNEGLSVPHLMCCEEKEHSPPAGATMAFS